MSKYRTVNFNDLFQSKSIEELVKDINNNRTIWQNNKEFFLKKLLRESDLLVLDIGMIELEKVYNKTDMSMNNLYFNKIYQNLQKLIIEIKKYSKEKILFIGYYNPSNYYDSRTDEFFYNLDLKLNRLMMDNGITYISTYELVKGNSHYNNIYLNEILSNKIADIIAFYY